MITPTNKSELSASKQKFAVRCYLEQRYFFHLWSEDRVSMHSHRVWLAVFLASTLFFTVDGETNLRMGMSADPTRFLRVVR